MEVSDNGFTERVMQHLPDTKTQMLSRLWTMFCIIAAVVLFVLMRGWELVGYGLMMLLNNLHGLQSHVLMVAALALVLGVLSIADVLHRERYSVI